MVAPLLGNGSDTGSAPMDALMKIVEWMLLSHVNLFNYILSAPHELQSLPMRHLYLSSPAAHPVFITQRNWWQLVHFSFGSVADSMFFIACFNSSFIFYQYSVCAFHSSASTTFNPCFAAVASRRADRCVSLSKQMM